MEYVKTNELYHHGVLGQKWGHRNGPPYPLKPGQHSSAEKKAGWQKSVKGGDGDVKKKKHSVKEVLKTTKEVYRDANRYSMKNPKEAFKTTVSHPIQSSTPYMIKQRLNGKKTIIDKKVEEQNSGKTGGFRTKEESDEAKRLLAKGDELWDAEDDAYGRLYEYTESILKDPKASKALQDHYGIGKDKQLKADWLAIEDEDEQNFISRVLKKAGVNTEAFDKAAKDYNEAMAGRQKNDKEVREYFDKHSTDDTWDTSVVGGLSRRTLEKAENSSRRRLNNDATNYKAKRSATVEAKAANKQEQTKESRAELRAAKQQQKEAEKKLKQDLKAEQGRELYAQGKTVEKYNKSEAAVDLAIGAGGNAAAYVLAKNGQTKAAAITAVASTSIAVGYEVYAEFQKNKLRAYYANN